MDDAGTAPHSREKIRIAAWTQSDWAFGRIAHGLQHHLGDGFEMEIFDWGKLYPTGFFRQFDLVYVPVWDHVRKFRALYPEVPPERLCFSVHCRAELFHYDIARDQLVEYDEDIIEGGLLPEELVEFLHDQKAVSVVSPEVHALFLTQYGLTNLVGTMLGVDLQAFIPEPPRARTDEEPLVVVHTLPRRGVPREVHGYDAKRSWIVAAAEARLAAMGANVRFLFAEERLPLAAMPDFYRAGDVHVCVSHSEGLPTVGLEAAACGLAQISTPVGVMPLLVEGARTGFLLREAEPRRIVDELCERLRELEWNRELLRAMKANAIALRPQLAWQQHIGAWRTFFRTAATAAVRQHAVEPLVVMTTGGPGIEPWIERCAASVAAQTVEARHVIRVGSEVVVEHLRQSSEWTRSAERCDLKHSEVYSFEAALRFVRELPPETIVIWLDGDDWFTRPDALSIVAREYERGAWMTYGSFCLHPPEAAWDLSDFVAHPREVIDANAFRNDRWRASHLRTSRAGLLQRIRHADLCDDTGNLFRHALDQALVLPMLEMAGERAHFIPEVLYCYNTTNPASSHNRGEEGLAMRRIEVQQIRGREPYQRLTERPW